MKIKLKWHLPKWTTADVPTPVKRTVNFVEMSPAELRRFSGYVATCMAPLAQGNEKRRNYVMSLVFACWEAQKLSTLEKLALVA